MKWLRRIADRIVNGRYLNFEEADWIRELERVTASLQKNVTTRTA